MNKYMLVLLLAAPGAVYAMEQSDTPPAGVGSVAVPGASLLALLGDRKDASAAEEAFLDKYGDAFAKDMAEVKKEVRTLNDSLDELQGAFATLQKEEGNQNGTAEKDPAWAKLEKGDRAVKLMAIIMELQDKDHTPNGGVRALHSSSAYKTMSDRKRILDTLLYDVTEYGKNNMK